MLDILKIGLKLLEMKLEASEKFHEEITQKFQENKSILEKRYNEEEVNEDSFENICDILVDNHQEQQEFENLANMLVVSHNYFIFEHFMKLLVGNLLKKEENLLNEKNKKYKRWDMKQILKFFNEKKVNLKAIEGFQDCNILRLLVNDIKHNGARVSKELAEAKGENLEDKEIKEIKIFCEEVRKYSKAIKLFSGKLICRCKMIDMGKL